MVVLVVLFPRNGRGLKARHKSSWMKKVNNPGEDKLICYLYKDTYTKKYPLLVEKEDIYVLALTDSSLEVFMIFKKPLPHTSLLETEEILKNRT